MQWISLFKHQQMELENRKTSPCSSRAPNLLHVLPSRMVGWNELCNPANVKQLSWAINYPFARRKCDKQWDFFGEEKVSFSELFCLCDLGLWTRWSTSTLLLRSSGFKSFWPIHRPDLSLTPSQPWPLNVNHIIHNFNGTRNPLHPTITL